jgi:peptidyl-prolyl cis-trans isomerase C
MQPQPLLVRVVVMMIRNHSIRDIQLGDYTLPFSPMTVITMLISFILLNKILTQPTSIATASHILLDGVDAEKQLITMKSEIKNDYTKFQLYAKEHSKCPSGQSAGGSLGTFHPGQMVPAFDKAIFGTENKVGEVIGPIQTVRDTDMKQNVVNIYYCLQFLNFSHI